MFRKDREVTDRKELIDILQRCDTIRLGMFKDEYPYVIPVSFGFDIVKDNVIIYFHGATKGQKVDCIKRNTHVCIEGDTFYKVETTANGITSRYESLVGFGIIQETNEEEKIYGLKKLIEHYQIQDYSIDRCSNLNHTTVYKIIITELTGKRNLPEEKVER